MHRDDDKGENMHTVKSDSIYLCASKMHLRRLKGNLRPSAADAKHETPRGKTCCNVVGLSPTILHMAPALFTGGEQPVVLRMWLGCW